MKLKNYLFLCCILFAAALTIGCANNLKPQNPLQEKYGPDADYFIGLQELQNKDTKKALRVLKVLNISDAEVLSKKLN